MFLVNKTVDTHTCFNSQTNFHYELQVPLLLESLCYTTLRLQKTHIRTCFL